MKKIFILIFILVTLVFCSAVEIVADLPSDRWVEIDSGDPIILKSYIVKPDRKDINIMVIVEEYPQDSEITIEQIMNNYQMGLMSNDLFKDGDYKSEMNVKIGNNVWNILKYRKNIEQFQFYHDSFIIIKSNTIIYVTFFTLKADDYKEYFGELKSFLEKIKFK